MLTGLPDTCNASKEHTVKNWRILRILFFSVAGMVMVIWLLRSINPNEVFRMLLNSDWRFWSGGAVFGILSHMVNGKRISWCIGRHLPGGQAAAVSAVHAATLSFLPMRSGELSFILLTRKYAGRNVTGSIAGLGLMRFSDIVVFLVLSSCSTIMVLLTVRHLVVPLLILTILVLCLLLAVIVLAVHGSSFLRRLHDYVGFPPLRRVITIAIDVLKEVRTTAGRMVLQRVLFLTFVYWSLVLAQSYLFFLSFLYIRPDNYIILFSMVNLVALLPVHGFLNIGTNEVVNVAILGMLGYAMGTATGVAIGCHLLTIMSSVVFGGSGVILLTVFGVVFPVSHKKTNQPDTPLEID